METVYCDVGTEFLYIIYTNLAPLQYYQNSIEMLHFLPSSAHCNSPLPFTFRSSLQNTLLFPQSTFTKRTSGTSEPFEKYIFCLPHVIINVVPLTTSCSSYYPPLPLLLFKKVKQK